jgi:uncharacterized pyridoxal phosphate-containing UPF0001 family protein
MRGRFNGNGNFTDNNDQIKSEFTYLKSIFDKTKKLKIENCQLEIISMGMSGDYQLAIECGSTMVRIEVVSLGKINFNGNGISIKKIKANGS